jgi:hypothetical protein
MAKVKRMNAMRKAGKSLREIGSATRVASSLRDASLSERAAEPKLSPITLGSRGPGASNSGCGRSARAAGETANAFVACWLAWNSRQDGLETGVRRQPPGGLAQAAASRC